jgi:hypothetical protein
MNRHDRDAAHRGPQGFPTFAEFAFPFASACAKMVRVTMLS